MRIVAIAVVGSNGVIGDGEDQPFKIKADWARFKRTTMGHHMVMGRATFAAMTALPGRTSVVVTHDPDGVRARVPADVADRVIVVGSLEAAFEAARERGEDTCYVTGGGQIYAQALPECDELDLTEVHEEAPGDVRFPDVGPEWREVSREEHADHTPAYAFVRYERA